MSWLTALSPLNVPFIVRRVRPSGLQRRRSSASRSFSPRGGRRLGRISKSLSIATGGSMSPARYSYARHWHPTICCLSRNPCRRKIHLRCGRSHPAAEPRLRLASDGQPSTASGRSWMPKACISFSRTWRTAEELRRPKRSRPWPSPVTYRFVHTTRTAR